MALQTEPGWDHTPGFASSPSIRARISSRTFRNARRRSSWLPTAFEGSGKDQCRRSLAPGKTRQASFASSQTVMMRSRVSPRQRSSVSDSWAEISTPISAMTETASGLTRVASVPELNTSKRSPAMPLNNPSTIWERAELWVHRNRTRVLSFARRSAIIAWYAVQMGRGLGEELSCGRPVERVEAPFAAPLLMHQPCRFELAKMIGDLRLTRIEVSLKLADADASVLIPCRNAAVG